MPQKIHLDAFFKVIEMGTFLDDDKRKQLSKLIQLKFVPKGVTILNEGMPCTHLFFYVRDYSEVITLQKMVKKLLLHFHLKMSFFTNIKGFINGINSNETIVALESSYVCVIDRTDYFNLLKNNSSLAYYSHEIINKHRVELEDRIRVLQNGIAKDKLIFFEEYYPGLSKRVPKKYIASFLGMRYETLHRAAKSNQKVIKQSAYN
ncbi:MAG TPA: Crp/Fnr family transcriptional regulator [Bacteroidia bacterium]|nr:Crp/Fnr family transcriptional regulator [Bacteroidia bacterium]